ncbi:MAG: prepilin-type N-terminal cleavage/methylation domain-containing protein [bacterium]|nr:prepilin-type N-terminal cleavage/methylation domain-containing protein [bacterium]
MSLNPRTGFTLFEFFVQSEPRTQAVPDTTMFHENQNVCKTRTGFTLVELLVYIAIFSMAAVFLISILTTVTRTQVRQASANDVTREITFVADTIQRYVRAASAVESILGVPTSTLVLRMSTATVNDRVKIYVNSEGTAIYVEEIPDGQAAGTPVALTDDRVTVGQFLVTPFQNPGGTAVVEVNMTLVSSSGKQGAQVARSWQSAIAKVSAATFDSNLLPVSDIGPNRGIGTALRKWQDLFLSGTISTDGGVGIGTVAPAGTAKLRSAGDIGVTTSAAGIVLTSPNGTCYRIGVSNAGTITTSTATCPASW